MPEKCADLRREDIARVHADVVGSLLRSPELLAARKARVAGRIDQASFKTVGDKAVDDAIALQE